MAVEISSYRSLTPNSSTFGFIYPAQSNKKDQLFDISETGSANVFLNSRGSVGVWRSGIRPCSDLWDHPRPLNQASMSQRPAASHDESTSTNDGHSITLSPVNIRPEDEIQQASEQEDSSGVAPLSRLSEQRARQAPAPYPPMQSSGDRHLRSASRSLGVHNILNPAEPEDARPSLCVATTASSAAGAAEPAPDESTSTSRPSTRSKRALQSSSISSGEGTDHSRPRKTLFPKSPRSSSLGGGGTGVFLQSTKPQRGAEPAIGHTVLPGTYAGATIPPLPSLPQPPPYGYNFPPPVSTPPTDRRRSSGTTGPSGLSHSQQTSPQASYFAYAGQPSNAQQLSRTPGAFTPGHYQPMESHSMGGLRLSQPPIKQEEGPYNPMHGRLSMPGGHEPQGMQPSSARISVLVVDRVSGSRSADEKRKHNAAASSRFRERRKKHNDELKRDNEELVKKTKALEEQLEETRQRLEQTEREAQYYRDVYHRNAPPGGSGMHQPPAAPPPFRGVAYGHPSVRIGGRPSDEEERPAQRRRTQGPEQGEQYTLPPATTYQSPQTYQSRPDDARSTQSLQPPRSASGSMSVPSPMPRSPYEQYPPGTNGGGGYFRGLHSGPLTTAPSQTVSSQPPFSSQQPQTGERR